MSLGSVSKKITVNLIYTPPENINNPGNPAEPVIISIGDGKNQISLDLLSKIINYARSGDDPDSKSFNDLLAAAMYKGLSNTEKSVLKALKTDKTGFANSQLVIKEEDTSVDDYNILMGLPTEEYLNDLKNMEELFIKNQELIKFHKKMDKISGNQPLNELYNDVAGTNIRLSNLHITDIGRLNDFKIHSTAFA